MTRLMQLKKIAIIMAVFIVMSLAACAGSADQLSGQPPIYVINEEFFEEDANDATDGETDDNATVVTGVLPDINPNEGIGGDFRECYVHSRHFHALDIFIGTIVDREEFEEWFLSQRALRTSHHEECLINVYTLIRHFGITRETFQQLIDDTRVDFRLEYNLDVLFSGNRALIEEFYSTENEELHRRMASERRGRHYSEILMNLQRIVNDNTEMSRYFHDIWTYAHFSGGKSLFAGWMQELIDKGQYDRVNIVEFVYHFGLYREAFERIVNSHNMLIFTHYNFDIIFSGDQRLIESYYSIENQALHTAQVQEAFERYASTRGMPDMDWMLHERDNDNHHPSERGLLEYDQPEYDSPEYGLTGYDLTEIIVDSAVYILPNGDSTNLTLSDLTVFSHEEVMALGVTAANIQDIINNVGLELVLEHLGDLGLQHLGLTIDEDGVVRYIR